jgi:hypothetical protein
LTSTKWYNLREFKRDLIRDLREVKNLHRSIPLSTHGASIAQPSGGKWWYNTDFRNITTIYFTLV